MADSKFAELKTAIRQAELQREIADLPSSPKALRTLITILSEQGSANLKTDTGFGYLRAITSVTKTLEDVPPRLWGNATQEIEYILSFADRDAFLAPDELEVLKSTAQALVREITRQAGLAVRTAGMLSRGVKRLGESMLERGASSQNIFVRMGSKLALAAIERRRTTKEVGKEFARTRAGALGAVNSYRTPFSPLSSSPIGEMGAMGFGATRVRPAALTSGEPSQLNLPIQIEVEQLAELKKINKNLTQQTKLTENIEEENDKQRIVEQNRTSLNETEMGIEGTRMSLAGPGVPSTATSPVAKIATSQNSIGALIDTFGTGMIRTFAAPEVVGALTAAIGVAGLAAAAMYFGKDLWESFKVTLPNLFPIFGSAKNDIGGGGESGGAGASNSTPTRVPDAPASGGVSSVTADTKVSELSSEQLDALVEAQQKREGFEPGTIAYRHNNPGNIKWTEGGRGNAVIMKTKYGASKGEKAVDGGYFVRFPTLEAGKEAQKNLWLSPRYQQLPLGQALSLWSGGGVNNDQNPERRAERDSYRREIIRLVQEKAPAAKAAPIEKTPGVVPFSLGTGVNYSAPRVPQTTSFLGPVRNDDTHPHTFGMAPMFAPDIFIPEVQDDAEFGSLSLPSQYPTSPLARPLSATPSINRSAAPVSTLTGALTSQGQNVVVMNAPTMAPIVNVQGGGSTVVPMPIRTEPLENTLLALTRLNYV